MNLIKHSTSLSRDEPLSRGKKVKAKEEEKAGVPKIIEREIEVAPIIDEQEQQQREQRIIRRLRREGILNF